MRTVDIAVTIANAVCAAVALVGLLGHMPNVLNLGIVVGFVANFIALSVAAAVLILAVVRMRSSRARQVLTNSWLGIANGVLVLCAWMLISAIGVPDHIGARSSVTAAFSSDGIAVVIVRAFEATKIRVRGDPSARDIRISGEQAGGSKGYHSPDLFWRATPPEEWGLGFVAERFGDRLVISTRNEIKYIHELYYLEALQIVVPATITVVPAPRTLTGDGAPDLTPASGPN